MFISRPMGEYVMPAHSPKLPTQPQNAYIEDDKSIDDVDINITKEDEENPDVVASPVVDAIPNVVTTQAAAASPSKKKKRKRKRKVKPKHPR